MGRRVRSRAQAWIERLAAGKREQTVRQGRGAVGGVIAAVM